jgi:hypothetical protein
MKKFGVWNSLPSQIPSSVRSSWVVSVTRGWWRGRWPVTYDPNTWRSTGMLYRILWPGEMTSNRSQTDLLWGSEGQYTLILRKCIKSLVQKILGKLLVRKRHRICSFENMFLYNTDCILRVRILNMSNHFCKFRCIIDTVSLSNGVISTGWIRVGFGRCSQSI